MREIIKDVTREIDGEKMTFQLRKMNALQATCLLKFVTEKVLPVIEGTQTIFRNTEDATEEEAIKERSESMMGIIAKALGTISDEELINFEKRCLHTVYVSKPAGWQPVMMGDSFGVDELEYDALNVLSLCYEVVQFNFSGFFDGKSLASILPLQASSQPNA